MNVYYYFAFVFQGEPNYVWVSCNGQSPHDRENQGPIEYIPAPGFPHYYYPYMNLKGYMSPLVAVRFLRPKREHFSNFLSNNLDML